MIFHAAITVFSAPPTREPTSTPRWKFCRGAERRCTDFRECESFIADFYLASKASGRQTMLIQNLRFPFLLGRTETLRGTLFQRADRTNRSWDGPSSNWSRNCCQPGPQNSLAIPNRREHTLLGSCFHPLQ